MTSIIFVQYDAGEYSMIRSVEIETQAVGYFSLHPRSSTLQYTDLNNLRELILSSDSSQVEHINIHSPYTITAVYEGIRYDVTVLPEYQKEDNPYLIAFMNDAKGLLFYRFQSLVKRVLSSENTRSFKIWAERPVSCVGYLH